MLKIVYVGLNNQTSNTYFIASRSGYNSTILRMDTQHFNRSLQSYYLNHHGHLFYAKAATSSVTLTSLLGGQ